MPVITHVVPLPAGRASLTAAAVETSRCDSSTIGAWQRHDDAVDPTDPTRWTIEVPATAVGEHLRIREHLIVDGTDNAIDAHRVTVPDGGPHELTALPVVDW